MKDNDYFLIHRETVMKVSKENPHTFLMFMRCNAEVSDVETFKEINGRKIRLDIGEFVITGYKELAEMLHQIHQRDRKFSKPRYAYLLLKRLERKGYLTIRNFDGYKLISLNCFEELRVN